MADLHLAISNPEKSMEVFGKNWGDYIPRIKDSFDAKVKPEDTVLMPGDLSWATYLNEAKEDFSRGISSSAAAITTTGGRR